MTERKGGSGRGNEGGRKREQEGGREVERGSREGGKEIGRAGGRPGRTGGRERAMEGRREGGKEGAVDQIGVDVHIGPGYTCHAVKPVCVRECWRGKLDAGFERDGTER